MLTKRKLDTSEIGMFSSMDDREVQCVSGKSHCAVVLANLGIDLNEKDTHTMSLPIITPLRYIFLLLLLLFLVVGFPCISFDMCAEECSREIASRCRFGGHCKRQQEDAQRQDGRASERTREKIPSKGELVLRSSVFLLL